MKNKNSELSFLDIFFEVYRRKYLIFIITFLGLLISIWFSMNHKKMYESSIILNNKESNEIDSTTDLNNLASILNIRETRDNTLSKIIKSRTFNEKIIKHNKLFDQNDTKLNINYFEIFINKIKKLFKIPIINELPNISDYTNKFIDNNLKVIQEGDFITIHVSWDNPEEASRITNSYAIILRKHLEIEQEENINYQLKNLYKTLGVFERDINLYLDKLNEYINKNKTLNPRIEIEEVNKLIASFKIKILENRVEMASLNKISSKYILLKEKNHLLSKELNNLISPSKDFKASLYPISYKDFVKMNKDYEHIRRNLDMNVEIYKQLRTSIESLKIKLISENLFFSTVDTAIPSYISINGSRLSILFKGLLISFFLSILLVITIHLFNFYKSTI